MPTAVSHEFEENLIWRVAELLGVSPRDRIAMKRLVAENKSAGRDRWRLNSYVALRRERRHFLRPWFLTSPLPGRS